MMSTRFKSPHLRCMTCGTEKPLEGFFAPCPVCAPKGRMRTMEPVYDYEGLRANGTFAAWQKRCADNHVPNLWVFREMLPLPDGADPVTLVEGGTPLVLLPTKGPGRIWIKDETRNPTGSFKDRFQTVSISWAHAAGHKKCVSTTTGNHGTSMAAYAAKCGMKGLVFCDPDSPEIHRRLIQLFGSWLAVLKNRKQLLEWLVRERGWYPSTGFTPPVSTPYGIEGYKTLGYEAFFQLGRMPSRVLAPVSVGDVLYGPWKGFQELEKLGANGPLPRMYAIQSAGCDPVVQGFRAGAREMPVHPNPQTIAISIGDATGGWHALSPIYESNGGAETVTDAEIVRAMGTIGAVGIAAEPASAAPVAAALNQQKRGELGQDEDVVCIVTGSSAKWPDTLPLAYTPRALIDENPASVRAWIQSFDPE
ncbi:MAG: pyridoxal-phosphate dependent enzyme [Rhodospirillales bacterium]|nr:pyridoxal-phosphate dependent enzyme [Rhodospirillales bacterium]